MRRRLTTWSTLTKWRGFSGAFPSPVLKSTIGLAVRATPRPQKRKSSKAVTSDALEKVLATCSTGNLRDARDRAILMVGFASGGRRRDNIAGLRYKQLTVEAPIVVGGSPPLTGHSSWAHQKIWFKSRRGCLSHGAAG
ncbi:hypothetical protein FHP24_25825 [Aliirhizobium smilacinae]|uniref:Tyr recombinase domain-containing protein n=1 Tax=Aliirhizobium smilacinae TaxID=1395944 RepID=A0A5C4XCY1_9HYPH|nr:hypothetical protein FHP24_25825 [Rhizobium smilacinae]